MVVAGVCPYLRVAVRYTGRDQPPAPSTQLKTSNKQDYEVNFSDKNIFPGKVAEKTELIMQNLKWRGCVICPAH